VNQAAPIAELDASTVAWILYSVAMAAGREPARIAAISTSADAINHAVPTGKELQGSLRRLQSLHLVSKQGRSYTLTETGAAMVANAQKSSTYVSGVWKHLADVIGKISAVNP
jgi:hypothetical protein